MVTGGATGIGRAVLPGPRGEGLARRRRLQLERGGGARAWPTGSPGAFVARADLADPAQVEALVKQLQEVAGRVDVLVNNAGLQPRRADLHA